MLPVCPAHGLFPSPAFTHSRASLAAALAGLVGQVSLIVHSGPRARALLALRAAAARASLAPPRLDRDLAESLEAVRREGGDAVRSVVERVESELASPDPVLLETLGPALLGRAHDRVVLDLVAALLSAGRCEEATSTAAQLPRTQDRREAARQRAVRLARTGVRSGRFLPDPLAPGVIDRFPASLPFFLRLTGVLAAGAGETSVGWALLERLGGRERRLAEAHVPILAYLDGSVHRALARARSMARGSHRQRALGNVVEVALARSRAEDAEQMLAAMGPGLARERTILAVARHRASRGDIGAAGRLLARITSPALSGERSLVLVEIALAAGSFVTARLRLLGLPACLAEYDPSAGSRVAVLIARTAMEVPETLPRTTITAGEFVEALVRDHERLGRPPFPPAQLANLLARESVRPEFALPRLRRLGGIGLQDGVVSEWIALQAARLAVPRPPANELEFAFESGLRGVASAPRDAMSSQRAHEDEGVSAGPRGLARRRVLVRAARHVLRRSSRDALVADSRVRSLGNLGGGLAVLALEEALREMPVTAPVFERAFRVLAGFDPAVAARVFFRRYADLVESGRTAGSFLVELANRGAIEDGFEVPWSRLERLAPGPRWLAELVEVAYARMSSPPSPTWLEGVLRSLGCGAVPPPAELIGAAERRLERKADPVACARDLARNPSLLARRLWLRPPSLPSRARAWSPDRWRRVLTRIERDVGDVRAGRVRSYTSLVGRREIAGRLLAGEFPVGGAQGPWPLFPSTFRLRYLDKEEDLLTHLRLADCLDCCYNSTSSWYRPWDTQLDVLSLWKDPLSFSFHVERQEGRPGSWRPVGFVFGSYGIAEGDLPVLLLNGLYLKPRRPEVRGSVLEAIETVLARPLGMRRIGIANQFGGRGWLPPCYERRTVTVERWRALARKGVLVTSIDDDISSEVNQSAKLDLLYWKNL